MPKHHENALSRNAHLRIHCLQPSSRIALIFLIGMCLFEIVGRTVFGQPVPEETISESNIPERLKVLQKNAHQLANQNQFDRSESILREVITWSERASDLKGRHVGRALIDIASTLFPSGDYKNLETIFKLGIETLRRSSDTQLGDLIIALNNLATLYAQQGASEERDHITSSIVNLAEVYDGPVDWDSVQVFLSLGEIYEQSDQPKAVAILYRQVDRYMQKQNVPPETSLAWLERYAQALMANNEYARATDLWHQALTIQEKQIPFNGRKVAETLVQLGTAALNQNEFRLAESSLDRARHLIEESSLDGTHLAVIVHHTLGSVYLRMHRPERYHEAASHFQHAMQILKDIGQGQSSGYALELNQLAQVMELMGHIENANRYYSEAIGLLQKASDTNPLDLAQCWSDLGIFLLKQSRPSEAATAFEEAYKVWQSVRDAPVSLLANSLSNMALAQSQSGHFAEASEVYWQAITLRVTASRQGPAGD